MDLDLLMQLLRMIPPQQLGELISRIQAPERYVQSRDLIRRDKSGILPIQMRGMWGAEGTPTANVRASRGRM
jgi:hypothetical protein